MGLLELAFESAEDSLSVRRFAVHEAMSSLFSVSVWARSRNDDIDLESIVGRYAALRVANGLAYALAGARRWTGVCQQMEHVEAEATGVSMYYVRIAPALWLLTQRYNHRLFQHKSIPDIVDMLLAEWQIAPVWKIQRADYPKLELRTQYGESDFAFLSRLLEEAGISYYFADDDELGSQIVLTDAPHVAEARVGGSLPFVDSPNQSAEREFVSTVRVSRDVRPGRVSLRDHDFRRTSGSKVLGTAPLLGDGSIEDQLEVYRYHPGAALVEVDDKSTDRLVGDDKGFARHDDKAAQRRSQTQLESLRADKHTVSFTTNAIDLAPGTIFSMSNHPRSSLAPDRRLLVTELMLEGSEGGEWDTAGRAVFADQPYRPPAATPKPAVQGVQSALVVGPKGQEIHTDEHGRVRGQFHWDREGQHDENSSCWMRVSHGWGGQGYGMITIPRVGHEVLVAFMEGDPDLPMVIGSAFNATSRVPHPLPEHKTRSAWRSSSSPGGHGANEIMMDDAKGRELVYTHAERDMQHVVKRDRGSVIGKVDSIVVGEKYAVHVAQPALPPPSMAATGVVMVDRKITFTTGEASITLDGPDVIIKAKGKITVKSEGDDVVINGGPNVRINCKPAQPVAAPKSTVDATLPPVVDGSNIKLVPDSKSPDDGVELWAISPEQKARGDKFQQYHERKELERRDGEKGTGLAQGFSEEPPSVADIVQHVPGIVAAIMGQQRSVDERNPGWRFDKLLNPDVNTVQEQQKEDEESFREDASTFDAQWEKNEKR